MKLWVRTGKNGGVGTEYSGVASYEYEDSKVTITFEDGRVFKADKVFSVTEVPNG